MILDLRLDEFKDNGYQIIRNFIPQNVINSVLDNVGDIKFGEQHENYGKYRKDKRFEDENELPIEIKKLYDLYVQPIGEKILGSGNSFSDCQISIINHSRKSVKGWHIDGTWIAQDTNTLEGIPFFKLLVGIYLTDLSKPERGNLLISPKGHNCVANFFNSIVDKDNLVVGNVFKKLYNIKIPNLVSINVLPGDIIISHALTPHSIATNNHLERPVVYFRLGEYEKTGYPALSSLWDEWPKKFKK